MKRLTRKSSNTDMVWFVDHDNNDMDLEPCEMNYHHNRLAIQKLAEYEDIYKETGLTPEECVDVVRRYRDICKSLTLYDIQHIEEIGKIVRAFKEGKLLYNY